MAAALEAASNNSLATITAPLPARTGSRASISIDHGHGAASSPTELFPPPAAIELAAAAQKLSTTTIALTMMSLCLSVILSALDLTIITTAVPAIVGSFHSVAGYVWVGSGYILAYAAITPVWGSVADIWGRKPIMLIAVAIFLAGSLLCALAPNIDVMIAGRAIQGLGASGMSIMVNIVISDMFSLRERGLYLAITSIVWAVGSAVGPVIGGIFTTRLR
ncbi:MAG: hypothetical protein LQ342_008216 [Letrouitia transgressa]|nr:MAG: hypothetical protein LQ342_008216 [Letrouitia transgressa]